MGCDWKTCGIYALVFNVDDVERIYIGSTVVSFARRKVQHWSELRRGRHCNNHVQHLYNLYGFPEFRIIDECGRIDNIYELETMYIDSLGKESVLNFGPAFPCPSLGATRSEEARKKVSLANIGKKMLESTKAAIRKANLGSHRSDEAKQKISLAQKGKHVSEEARKKSSISHSEHGWTEKQRQAFINGKDIDDRESIALWESRITEIKQLYHENGYSVQRIAEYYGISESTFRRCAKLISLELKRTPKIIVVEENGYDINRRKIMSLWESRRGEIEYLYNEKGYSLSRVAKYYGVNCSTVEKYIKLMSIELRVDVATLWEGRKEEIEYLYNEKGCSLREIGRYYGSNYSTAKKYMELMSIEIRGR